MAHKIRNGVIETRTSRLKLPVARKPVFARIARGISVGYRRNQVGGTWVLKVADGKGGAKTQAIGMADDHDDANGTTILDYWQAQDKAKRTARQGTEVGIVALTVRKAAENYLVGLGAKNIRTASDTRGRLERHFLAEFGERPVSTLTKTALEQWLASLVIKSDDPERVRKSKDTANRVLSMVKALLNHAIRDPSNGLTDDSAWRLLRPFHGVARAREIHFSVQQAQTLIRSAEPDFANLLTAGFLTGARYGELVALNVGDFDPRSKTLTIAGGKTGRRIVILQPDAVTFFSGVAARRAPNKALLQRSDGLRWNRSHQQRRMAAALGASGLDKSGTFYALRHSYISRAIEGGVPLIIIAENCGTSVRMIENTYAEILAEKSREFIERGAPSLA
jgi:integrase